MKKNVSKILFAIGFGLVALTGCPGETGDDAGAAECELDTDCEGATERCNNLGECEEECTADTDCGGDRPVCNLQDDADPPAYVLEADGTRDLCICEAGSCGDGMMCGPDGICIEGDDVGCTADTDCDADEYCDVGGTDMCLCSTVGDEVLDDTTGDVLLVCLGDGSWAAPCGDSDCYEVPAIELCQDVDTTATDFNMCVDAEEMTAGCTEASGWTQTGTSPTVYDVETIDHTAAGCDVAGSTVLHSFFVSIYSTDNLTALTAQDVMFRPGFAAGGQKFFQDVGSSLTTDIVAVGSDFPNDYLATVYICGGASSPASAAVAVNTAGTADTGSNAYCFDPIAAAP